MYIMHRSKFVRMYTRQSNYIQLGLSVDIISLFSISCDNIIDI